MVSSLLLNVKYEFFLDAAEYQLSKCKWQLCSIEAATHRALHYASCMKNGIQELLDERDQIERDHNASLAAKTRLNEQVNKEIEQRVSVNISNFFIFL